MEANPMPDLPFCLLPEIAAAFHCPSKKPIPSAVYGTGRKKKKKEKKRKKKKKEDEEGRRKEKKGNS